VVLRRYVHFTRVVKHFHQNGEAQGGKTEAHWGRTIQKTEPQPTATSWPDSAQPPPAVASNMPTTTVTRPVRRVTPCGARAAQAKHKTFTGCPGPGHRSRDRPTHEVTTGLHRFAASWCGHTTGALSPPRVHTPTIHPTTDNPGGLWQACNTLRRSHVWKLFLRQVQTQTVTAQYDSAPRRVGTNPIPQHCCAARTDSEVPRAGAIHRPL
jgi:hypothetical protein